MSVVEVEIVKMTGKAMMVVMLVALVMMATMMMRMLMMMVVVLARPAVVGRSSPAPGPALVLSALGSDVGSCSTACRVAVSALFSLPYAADHSPKPVSHVASVPDGLGVVLLAAATPAVGVGPPLAPPYAAAPPPVVVDRDIAVDSDAAAVAGDGHAAAAAVVGSHAVVPRPVPVL